MRTGALSSARLNPGRLRAAVAVAAIFTKSRRLRRWGKRYSFAFMGLEMLRTNYAGGGKVSSGKKLTWPRELERLRLASEAQSRSITKISAGGCPRRKNREQNYFNTAWWNSFQSSRLFRFTASLQAQGSSGRPLALRM